MGAFSFIKLLFFKKSKNKLIVQLEKEHTDLINIYNKIEILITKEQFSKILKNLNKFYYKYKRHVLLEDNYFYAKLLKKFEGYESIIDFIKETKEELNYLTSSLEKFLNQYSSEKDIKDKFNIFTKDFKKLGDELLKRIEFEETRLYVLY